jgi:hypothetical protein
MAVALLCSLPLAGCGPDRPSAASEPETSGGIADTMAQRPALDAGRRAAETLRAVAADRGQSLDEASGD